MITKMCAGCGTVILYPQRYCGACQKITDNIVLQHRDAARKKYNKAYNKRRDPRVVRFYQSKEWKTLSAAVMRKAGYVCADCNSLATEVHHIEELAVNWDRRLDSENLVAVCTSCHNKRDGRKGGWVKKYGQKNILSYALDDSVEKSP